MPLNSGPGIGGRPGGSSFAPPSTTPAAAKTKWVIAEAGSVPAFGSAAPAPAPVHGSCIDILGDSWAWLSAVAASVSLAYMTQDSAETSTTAKSIFLAASFAGYLCVIFIAGFAVAAFLWFGSKSKWAMRFGFLAVAISLAAVPFAVPGFRVPQLSHAASLAASAIEGAQADPPVVVPSPPVAEPPPPVEQSQPVIIEQPSITVEPFVPQPDPAPAQPQSLPLDAVPLVVVKPAPPNLIRPSTTLRQGSVNIIPTVSAGELQIVLSEMRNLLGEIRSDAGLLQDKLQSQGLDTMLAPTSFAGRTRINDARRRLVNIKRIVDDYERIVIARFEAFPDRIRQLPVSGYAKDVAVKAFQKNQAESLKKLREIAQLDRAILVEADRLFLFMDSRLGRFKVTDRILFRDITDAERYNAHINRLQELAREEELAVVENQKAAINKLSMMERELMTTQRR